MGVVFVPCRDEDHLQACHEAGLLWINYGTDSRPCWEMPYGHTDIEVLNWYRECGQDRIWRHTHFAVLVED